MGREFILSLKIGQQLMIKQYKALIFSIKKRSEATIISLMPSSANLECTC